MKEIILITGGQRSGKSRYGQEMAEGKTRHPIYLATARVWDEDFKNRIKRHQQDRGDGWQTLEKEKHLGELDLNGKVVLMDCVTLWLTSIFHDNDFDLDKSLDEAKKDWTKFIENDFQLIVISNELGMGVHGESPVSRKFADLQGWMNQHIAAQADQVLLMVSGIPVKIKP